MATPVNSTTSAQDSYRAQLAGSRSDRSMNSLTENLKSAEKMASALGTSNTGVQNALQRVSGNQSAANAPASTRVTISPEAAARQRAEQAQGATNTRAASNAAATESTSRPERRRFASVDEAISYGANRASEQASARATERANQNSAVQSTRNTETTSRAAEQASPRALERANQNSAVQSARNTSSTSTPSRAERRQFASVDEAIAYGASRASEQATSRNSERVTQNQPVESAQASERSDRRRFASVDDAIAYGAQRAVEQYKQQLALGSAQNGGTR